MVKTPPFGNAIGVGSGTHGIRIAPTLPWVIAWKTSFLPHSPGLEGPFVSQRNQHSSYREHRPELSKASETDQAVRYRKTKTYPPSPSKSLALYLGKV